jgi:NADH dehydrogenase
MKNIKNILIVGGGYAGVKAAKVLHKKYKRSKNVEITLVDRNRFHTLMTELHEVAGDRVPQASVKVSYDRIFSGTSVNVVHDEIVDVDLDGKKAVGKTGEYKWDRVLFATGGAPADFNIEGVKDNTLSLWSIDDALLIRRHLETTYRKAALERNLKKRRQLMTVVVAGGGFTGVELVGELVEFLPVLCKKYALPEDETTLINLEAMGHILGMLPEDMRTKAVSYMEKKGVEVKTNALITKATKSAFHLKDGEVIKAGTKVWTCGVKGNCFTNCTDLKEGKAGRKEVDSSMRSPGFDDIYIAGDGIWFLEDGKPVPQIVEAAEQTAETAAHNIAVDIDAMLGKNSGEHKAYKGSYHGFMVSIGSKYAVSHTGGVSLKGFTAMALKHVVNMYYLFTLAGLNSVWAYFKREILDIRHGRSLIGSFAEWKVPVYWILPLRVYIGVMWIIQGIQKATGGWLNRANDFVSVALPGADVVSAASEEGEWVEGAAEAVSGSVVEAAHYAEAMLSEPWGLYVWVSQWTVNLAPYLFQSGIVVFEILIGLAMIGGAFTWLAAAASFIFSIMLIVGAMTDASIFWYMVGALALMGGAGRAFGLDYWIMPFIKKWWNGTKLARSTFLYVGEPTIRKQR